MNIDDGTVIDTIPPTIINHLFKGLNHSSVIEIEDSKLDMQGNRFINIAIYAIESIGRSHITAQGCLWHVNNMAVLYLHPTGMAEISNSVFKGSNATIVTQQATLVLNHCEFIDINAANPVKATQNSQITLNDCRLNGINKGTVRKLSAHSDKYLH